LTRRQCRANPGIVGDFPFFHRHIEIDAAKDALSANVYIAHRFFIHGAFPPYAEKEESSSPLSDLPNRPLV
jgi:hypothetical protein